MPSHARSGIAERRGALHKRKSRRRVPVARARGPLCRCRPSAMDPRCASAGAARLPQTHRVSCHLGVRFPRRTGGALTVTPPRRLRSTAGEVLGHRVRMGSSRLGRNDFGARIPAAPWDLPPGRRVALLSRGLKAGSFRAFERRKLAASRVDRSVAFAGARVAPSDPATPKSRGRAPQALCTPADREGRCPQCPPSKARSLAAQWKTS
jgi:hypothetical protein